MTALPLALADYRRGVAREADVLMRNRFIEVNPVLTPKPAPSFIARPGLKNWLTVGDGPIRGLFAQSGSFKGDLFVMSFNTLYRVDNLKTITELAINFYGGNAGTSVSMAATAKIGSTPEHLFIADGQTLRVYDGAVVTQVAVPNDVGVISVAFINGYIIVVPVQVGEFIGRFYWIEPGETTIDPLNFATAERSADPVYQVVVFGDQFWLAGESTTETWYMTGDLNAPMSRMQGILFDRGTFPGTALQVKDSMFIVDPDGGVFQIQGGAQRISTPDIEERIRRGINTQAYRTI